MACEHRDDDPEEAHYRGPDARGAASGIARIIIRRQQSGAPSRDYHPFVAKAKNLIRGYSWLFVVTKSLPVYVKIC